MGMWGKGCRNVSVLGTHAQSGVTGTAFDPRADEPHDQPNQAFPGVAGLIALSMAIARWGNADGCLGVWGLLEVKTRAAHLPRAPRKAPRRLAGASCLLGRISDRGLFFLRCFCIPCFRHRLCFGYWCPQHHRQPTRTRCQPPCLAGQVVLLELEQARRLFRCKSFRLEAGAGAGKTYSLIKALQFLIERNHQSLPKRSQQIACITFTNVAKNEIAARTDRSPLIYCETNHAFCWALISAFQKSLRTLVEALPAWKDRIEEAGGSLGKRAIEYSLGHRSIRDDRVSLHHDDVLPLTISLMEHAKFRRMIADRFPIILVDEYQDTDNDWVEAIKVHFLGQPGTPLFGFFGDHWQKIYGDGCGKLEHAAVTEIGKEANFRSVKTVVDCLNRMRPELRQFVEDPEAVGQVHVFHTNDWPGPRQKGAHWAGDLPSDAGHAALGVSSFSVQ